MPVGPKYSRISGSRQPIWPFSYLETSAAIITKIEIAANPVPLAYYLLLNLLTSYP
jgi:hypothetical protein